MDRRVVLALAASVLLGVGGCGGDGGSGSGGGGQATGGGGAGASGGGGGSGGTGGLGGGGGGAGGQGGSAPTQRRVFVTSRTYDGALGGIAGADAACQKLANAASLGATWKAWVGDDTSSPSTNFVHSTVPYVRIDGTQVAADWTDLTDATLDAPIDHDETGAAIDPAGNTHVWTGASTDGGLLPYHCMGWTSTDPTFTPRGLATSSDSFWVMSGPDPCTTKNHLYCFEQ